MIRDLLVQGVTVFPNSERFEFVPGMNVVVGGNDSGKSHLLKLCYVLARWSAEGGKKSLPEKWAEEQRLRSDMMRVFSAHNLAGLTAQNRGNDHARICASLQGEKVPEGLGRVCFTFNVEEEEEGLHIQEMPQRFLNDPVVFLTAREVFAIYPSFVQLGKRFPEILDGACWDLCRYLENEVLEKPTSPQIGKVIGWLAKLIGGHVVKTDGRFYLNRAGTEPIEMSLVAEGFKRLGALYYLLNNGSICKGTVLCWDEPEMNLNASNLPILVQIMVGLVKAGVQLILSSHSLFLLRELTIQLSEPKNQSVSRQYFALQVPKDRKRGVRVMQGDALEDIGKLDSLEAEIEQADRYLNL